MYSDIDISSLCTRAVLGLYSVDATVVSISITDKHTAGANANGNLNVNHGPLVNLFAILVPNNLRDRASSDATAELHVLSSLQGEYLIFRPLNLRSNWRLKRNKKMGDEHIKHVRNLLFIQDN